MPDRFTMDDVPALVDLSESIGWRQTLEDWRTLLGCGAVFGDREASGGRILSSSGIFPYGANLASIGVVIVRAEARRRGLARAALQCCLEFAGSRPIMLVATPEGYPLYESCGFRTVEEIVTLVAPAGTTLPANGCSSLDDAALPSAIALDRAAYAADRGDMLARRWRQSAGGAILDGGAGFALKVVQRDALVLGPVIAPDEPGAARLVGHLTCGYPGTLRIDVPASQSGWVERLCAAGFAYHDRRPMMLRGTTALRGERKSVFALVNLGLG